MRLLVTRPEPDNERTAAALSALGHDVVLAPMLRIELMAHADLGSGPFAGVLLTSANGARAIAAHPRRGELTNLPALAVGAGSAQAARDAGFADVTSAEGDGSDLARRAVSGFAGVARPLLYPAGEERARDLESLLAPAGIAVVTAVVYRTVKASAFPGNVSRSLAERAIDGVLHFSQRSVEAYLDCAAAQREAALMPLHYCLSGRAAEPLRRAGAARISVADRPDEARLLALVMPAP